MRLVECTGVESQRTYQMYLHERPHFISFVPRSLTAAVILQEIINSTRLVQTINVKLMAHKRSALTCEMDCTIIAGLLIGINDAFRVIGVNFDEIIAAILPC